MSMIGFGTEQSPIIIEINDLEIFKTILPDKEFNNTDFHYNIQNFARAVKEKDSRHEKNASYSNLLLIEG